MKAAKAGRIAEEAQAVAFDLNAPRLSISRSDRFAFAVNQAALLCDDCDASVAKYCEAHLDESRAHARCTRAIIREIVVASFGNSMDRKDGRIWEGWHEALEALDDDGSDTEGAVIEVTLGHLRWLKRQTDKEDLKIKVGLIQWREALATYIDELVAKAAEPTAIEG